MLILGVGGLNHDPAVALLRDGQVLFALESEKVTRHRREVSLCPVEAIRAALTYARVSLSDLDAIVTNWDGRPLSNYLYVRQITASLLRGTFPWPIIPTLWTIAGTHTRLGFLRLESNDLPKIIPVRHHLAHLGSCYTLSGFDEAATAIVDGSGEHECTSLYLCRGRHVSLVRSFNLPLDSLGHVYTMATRRLGFGILGDEFKVMGMASLGKRREVFRNFFTKLVKLLPDGRYRIDRHLAGNYFVNGFQFPNAASHYLPAVPSGISELKDEHFDFAFELQRRTEEALLHVLTHFRRVSGMKRLCMAGGVALNAVANGRIIAEAGFDDVFIQPAANDAGTPLGAAAFYHYHVLGCARPKSFRSPYLGPDFSDEEIEAAIQMSGLPCRQVSNPADSAAKLIHHGKVIGWFQGRTEFGPRSLGNRSILASPLLEENLQRVNRIKGREWFRPLAPAVAHHAASIYFDEHRASRYMLSVSRVRPEHRRTLAAVVHVDGSARLQTVSPEDNSLFHALIEALGVLSGVPVVLNTSFNLGGEPMVNTPRDAIRAFVSLGLDALCIGPYLVEKR